VTKNVVRAKFKMARAAILAFIKVPLLRSRQSDFYQIWYAHAKSHLQIDHMPTINIFVKKTRRRRPPSQISKKIAITSHLIEDLSQI